MDGCPVGVCCVLLCVHMDGAIGLGPMGRFQVSTKMTKLHQHPAPHSHAMDHHAYATECAAVSVSSVSVKAKRRNNRRNIKRWRQQLIDKAQSKVSNVYFLRVTMRCGVRAYNYNRGWNAFEDNGKQNNMLSPYVWR